MKRNVSKLHGPRVWRGHHISNRVACWAGALQVAGYPFSTVRVKCQAHNLSTRTVLRDLRGLGELWPGCAPGAFHL